MNLDHDEVIFQAEPRRYIQRGTAFRSVTDGIEAVLGNPFLGVNKSVLDFAKQRGSAVHAAMDLLTAGRLDWSTVDTRIEGYVRAAEKFHKDYPGKIVYTEKKLVSKRLGFGGTPDIVKFFQGRRCLFDYKTSQQMMPRMCLQTMGYKFLNDDCYPNAPIHRRYGLKLRPNGTYKLCPHDDPDDAKAFMDLREELKVKEKNQRWKLKYR